MAERSLRGMKIGANSLETDQGVSFVARRDVFFVCPEGHTFAVPMAVEAVPPATWGCRCGREAKLRDETVAEEQKPVKPPRTHWDMLMERRNIDELQVLLDERLGLLREGKLRLRFRRR